MRPPQSPKQQPRRCHLATAAQPREVAEVAPDLRCPATATQPQGVVFLSSQAQLWKLVEPQEGPPGEAAAERVLEATPLAQQWAALETPSLNGVGPKRPAVAGPAGLPGVVLTVQSRVVLAALARAAPHILHPLERDKVGEKTAPSEHAPKMQRKKASAQGETSPPARTQRVWKAADHPPPKGLLPLESGEMMLARYS